MTGMNVGLIGTGYMGKCHALAWNAVAPVFGDCARPRLALLAEIDAGLAARRAGELGFDRSTGDWRELVADPYIDVVSITTPNAFHAEMAIAALEAGKHVWCEKPLAPTLDEAERMLAAARASGKVTIVGYNYIQNPVIRQIRALIGAGAIGTVNHVRAEMDEDFMADPDQPFYWKSAAASGYGALDDFAVHPLSLIQVLVGGVRRVVCDMARPYADRPTGEGGRRPVESHDIAAVLMRLDGDIPATLTVNRAAHGRKGRIALQIFGSRGSILFDQERMNEFRIYQAGSDAAANGYRTVLAGPQHPPYDKFVPAPGHGFGFNDLKVIECRQLIAAIAGEPFHALIFEDGIQIERAVHAMARSFQEERWVECEA